MMALVLFIDTQGIYWCLTLFTQSLNKYLLSLYHMLGPVGCARDEEFNRILSSSSFHFSGKTTVVLCSMIKSIIMEGTGCYRDIYEWHLISLGRRKTL